MSNANKITMFKGDNKKLVVSARFPDGNPVDLSQAKIWFTAKERASDADADAVISKRNTLAGGADVEIQVNNPAADGIFEVYLLPDDTQTINPGTYRYDIQIFTPNDGTATIVKDQLILREDVTKAQG